MATRLFSGGELSEGAFYSTFWRRQPLHIRGGAAHLPLPHSQTAFLDLAARLEQQQADAVRRNSSGVVFAQRIDAVDDGLRSLSEAIRRDMRWPVAWFDGVFTPRAGTIGCHWDASDNFVLQQTGTKIWRLQPPNPAIKHRFREAMLGIPVDSDVEAEPTAFVFEVDPGDLLYIPIFWPHLGTSMGESLSYSLVAGAQPSLDLLPLIYALLSEEELWWSPLPNAIGAAPSEHSSAISVELASHIEGLLKSLSSPTFISRVKQQCWDAREQEFTERLTANAEPPTR